MFTSRDELVFRATVQTKTLVSRVARFIST